MANFLPHGYSLSTTLCAKHRTSCNKNIDKCLIKCYNNLMEWLYIKNEDNSARFVLGQIFNTEGKTLLCFGINPSTASPECLDNTVKRVSHIAQNNGYENWIMLNIYPQRATNPNNMDLQCNDDLVKTNLLHIKNIAEKYPNSDVLLAYGNLISKRKYLKKCLDEIVSLLKDKYQRSIKIIKLTKLKNPIHPLYQSNSVALINYKA